MEQQHFSPEQRVATERCVAPPWGCIVFRPTRRVSEEPTTEFLAYASSCECALLILYGQPIFDHSDYYLRRTLVERLAARGLFV